MEFLGALGQVADPAVLFATFIGTLVGIIAAAIPGFTILMAVILVFPFTFSMSPLMGLSTLMGVYVGGFSGGQGFGGFSGFGDIFSEFFSGFGGGSRDAGDTKEKGADVNVEIELSFLDAAKGCKKTISYARK